jgi:flagellar basal-body rod protein FlgC
MSLFNIFGTTASAMNAQSIRLNLVASNIANASTVAGSKDEAFKALNPVFSQVLREVDSKKYLGVAVSGIERSGAENMAMYQPENPLADENGYIYQSNVNSIEEMANMISASRNYQTSVEVLNTSKAMMLKTLKLGQ